MTKELWFGRAKGASFIRRTSLFLAVLLLLSILASCVTADPAVEKQKLVNRIGNINVEDCATVAECFALWKFPKGYDARKLRDVEKTMHGGFYQEIDVSDMATEAANCFMRLYYDRISFSDKVSYTDALIQCMVMALDDRYAVYRTEEEYETYTESMSGSYGGIGMTVRKNYEEGTARITRLVMNSPAERAGLMVGDFLYSVEGLPVTIETLDAAFSKLSGDIGEPVQFEVLRDGEILSFTIVRENMENMTVSYSISEDKIAYISVSSFKRSTYQYFSDAVKAATALGAIGFIFDMRSNPGGYLSSVLDVLDCLVAEGTELCSYGAAHETPTACLAADDDEINVPCVVICNGSTASAAELFTAALRDYDDMGILDVTIVGTEESTYGKGIMQSSYHFSDGSVLTMTSAFYNPPCGVNYHGEGIIPELLCEEEAALEVARQALFDLIDNK